MKVYGTATLKGTHWTVEADAHVITLLKRLLRKAERGNPGRIQISHSEETCRDLVWVADRYPLRFDPDDVARGAAAAHASRTQRVADILAGTVEGRRFELARAPRSYQAKSAQLLLEQGHLLVADEVGLGKTCTAIAAMTDPDARPALVVTLAHLPSQWEREVRKFAPGLQTHVLKRATPYEIPSFFGRAPDVIVCNYHKLAGWADHLATFVRYVVFDEVQELRRDGTDKYRGATTVARAARYRLGLSATPIYNYGDEIYNVLDALKQGCLGATGEFREEWCSPAAGGNWRLREPRAFGTWARDQGLIVRHTREQVGRELPAVTRILETVDVEQGELDRIEDAAADLAERFLRAGALDRTEKMVDASQLDGLVRQATGLAKARSVAAFVRLLVESGERVLLFGWHHAVYDAWARALEGLRVVRFTGEQSASEKDRARAAFVKGDADVLLMSLRSGAGLDGLQDAASIVVFGELDWSPGVHEQCIGRLHRDGQAKPVLAYYLMADAGSDPIVANVLGVKRDQVEGIRDPVGGVLEVVETDGNRIRRLAEDFLRRSGRKLPQAAGSA